MKLTMNFYKMNEQNTGIGQHYNPVRFLLDKETENEVTPVRIIHIGKNSISVEAVVDDVVQQVTVPLADIVNKKEFFSTGFNSTPVVYEAEVENAEAGMMRREDIIWQAIELEGFGEEAVLLETELKDENGECIDRDECFVIIDTIHHTDEPSKYIIWGNKKPHVFTVDRVNTRFSIV